MAGAPVTLADRLTVVATASAQDPLVEDAAHIIEAAQTRGERVSQRVLAARLRERGHRFSTLSSGNSPSKPTCRSVARPDAGLVSGAF